MGSLHRTQGASINAIAVGYDRNGNRTSQGADTFSYNAANQFSGGNIGGRVESFGYDGLGRRTFRSPNGGRTDAWYDRSGLSLETGAAMWEALLREGLYVNLARPPATPANMTLLRCSLCAEHTEAQVEEILGMFEAAGRSTGCID